MREHGTKMWVPLVVQLVGAAVVQDEDGQFTPNKMVDGLIDLPDLPYRQDAVLAGCLADRPELAVPPGPELLSAFAWS